MMQLSSRVQQTRASRPLSRRPAHGARRPIRIVAFREDERRGEQIKRDLEKNADKIVDGVRSASDRPNTDPQGVNHPRLDVSDLPLSQLGGLETQAIDAYKAPGTWLAPAFTRRREVFAGRLAIVGFAAALGWELLNPAHPGPLAATSILTGLDTTVVTGIFGLIVLQGVAGLIPGSATYSGNNKRDLALRPKGPPDSFINPVSHPFSFLGISRTIGFTKKNELFNGRLAAIGIFAGVLGEIRSGDGIIAQVARWMGEVPTEQWYSAAGRTIIAWSLFLLGLAWLTGNMGEIEGDESVY